MMAKFHFSVTPRPPPRRQGSLKRDDSHPAPGFRPSDMLPTFQLDGLPLTAKYQARLELDSKVSGGGSHYGGVS